MATIEQNGITFHNYNNSEVLPVSRTIRLGINQGLDEDEYGIVNAVDISWNEAEVDTNKRIKTTGELLSYIKGAYSSGNLFTDEQKLSLLELINPNSDNKTPLQVLLEQITALSNQITSLSDRVDTLEQSSSSNKSITWDGTNKRLLFKTGDTIDEQVYVVTGVRKTSTDGYNPGNIDLDLQDKLDKNKVSYTSDGTLTIDLS